MKFPTIPDRARTIIYVVAFTVAALTAAVLLILVAIGAADLATVKDIGLWVLGILGIGGHGLAVANRPTKTT
jgi:hypothetical protein